MLQLNALLSTVQRTFPSVTIAVSKTSPTSSHSRHTLLNHQQVWTVYTSSAVQQKATSAQI